MVFGSILKELQGGIRQGTRFGTKNVRKLSGFKVKVFLLLVPGILLGHYIDQIVDKLKREQKLGKGVLRYVILQTVFSALVMYLMSIYSLEYTNEFQNTYAGLFFVSLFFGMQTNYIVNLQQVLGKL